MLPKGNSPWGRCRRSFASPLGSCWTCGSTPRLCRRSRQRSRRSCRHCRRNCICTCRCNCLCPCSGKAIVLASRTLALEAVADFCGLRTFANVKERNYCITIKLSPTRAFERGAFQMCVSNRLFDSMGRVSAINPIGSIGYLVL